MEAVEFSEAVEAAKALFAKDDRIASTVIRVKWLGGRSKGELLEAHRESSGRVSFSEFSHKNLNPERFIWGE